MTRPQLGWHTDQYQYLTYTWHSIDTTYMHYFQLIIAAIMYLQFKTLKFFLMIIIRKTYNSQTNKFYWHVRSLPFIVNVKFIQWRLCLLVSLQKTCILAKKIAKKPNPIQIFMEAFLIWLWKLWQTILKLIYVASDRLLFFTMLSFFFYVTLCELSVICL